MPNWHILDSCRNAAVDNPPEFRVRVTDMDNQAAGVLPTVHIGPEADLRVTLAGLGIPQSEIDQAFIAPPNCPN